MYQYEGDCRLNSLSHLLFEEFGVHVSPAMCFGLGEGLDFFYWLEKIKHGSVIAILGRSLNIEEQFCSNVRIKYHEKSDERNELTFKKLLDNQKCVVVNVDKYYLRWMKDDKSSLQGNTHMGLHTLLCKSYCVDNETAVYNVADGTSSKHVNVKIYEDNLVIARHSKWEPFPPDGKYYYLELKNFSEKYIFSTVEKAIARNSRVFLTEDSHGVHALKNFIAEVESFFDVIDFSRPLAKSFLNMQFRLFYAFIYEFEMSHSFYRGLYGDFLHEVNQKLKIKKLEKIIFLTDVYWLICLNPKERSV